MLYALVAAIPPTLAALGAWFVPRRRPEMIRMEAMIENIMDWQVGHERHHVRVEGDGRLTA